MNSIRMATRISAPQDSACSSDKAIRTAFIAFVFDFWTKATCPSSSLGSTWTFILSSKQLAAALTAVLCSMSFGIHRMKSPKRSRGLSPPTRVLAALSHRAISLVLGHHGSFGSCERSCASAETAEAPVGRSTDGTASPSFLFKPDLGLGFGQGTTASVWNNPSPDAAPRRDLKTSTIDGPESFAEVTPSPTGCVPASSFSWWTKCENLPYV